MNPTITTLDGVYDGYGPIVGEAVTKLAALAPERDDLGALVDIVVEVVEGTMTTLGFEFERKEGF